VRPRNFETRDVHNWDLLIEELVVERNGVSLSSKRSLVRAPWIKFKNSFSTFDM